MVTTLTAGQQIIDDIKAYISKNGGSYRSWYVGISEQPRHRLFNDHNVNENDDWWIYRKATSTESARRIESHFINVPGTDGGVGGGDWQAVYIYAYRKSARTNP